ncbi:hypothetical protein SEA_SHEDLOCKHOLMES_44 [Mycobacterium phage ShedlockHolmes]|uniref:Uncharacterized protein n=1 Tax=Mycobacterium phage ShedlockHolmes TaxID=1647313 RepID=A0A0F6WF62_9CAUD|nr:hypothetical protein SEA_SHEDLOCKHOLMES_44 [Mycobacterium phage ShedlockHolmes]AKF15221.1 hypothetical protein SEA_SHEDLOCKHOLMES_44 [Mycobacterium phage ShedlockHolmes]
MGADDVTDDSPGGNRPTRLNRDITMSVMAEVDREPVESSVRKWRSAARFYAKQAQELFLDSADEQGNVDGDEAEHIRRMSDVTALAALATMYFSMAADVECFGKLPPVEAADDE